MNLNEFMKRMRKAQEELQKRQDRLSRKEFRIIKQGVVIKVFGSKKVIGIYLDSQIVDPDDPEALEMVLTSAFNEVFAQIDAEFAKIEADINHAFPFPF